MRKLIFKMTIKLLIRPYIWAVGRDRQNVATRSIRAAWRAL